MNHQTAYQDFTARFKLLISKNQHLITTTLSNIFTMRLVGEKTNDRLAESSIAEFINRNMYDFKAQVSKRGSVEILNEVTEKKLYVLR
jgi:hypothetical protein